MKYNTDVLIIGAGAVGTAIARELSKFQLDVILCDKNDDVGGDASKSCSKHSHAFYAGIPAGTGLQTAFLSSLRGAGDTDKFLRQHNAGSQ